MPVVNRSLYNKTRPAASDLNFARDSDYQVPSPNTPDAKVLQGSQNRWLATEAVKHLADDFSGSAKLEAHFTRERDSLGDWGSEQDSPIYWGAHVATRIAIASKTYNPSLKQLAIKSIASFLYRSKRSLYGNIVLQAGMRGAGHSETESYELNYIINNLFGDKSIKPKNHWTKNLPAADEGLNQHGWIMSQPAAFILNQAAELSRSPGFVPNKIRVPKHILEGPNYKFVWVEYDINNNTPFMGLNGFFKSRITLPKNYAIHIRQQDSQGVIHFGHSFKEDTPILGFNVEFKYTGKYQDLAGGEDNSYAALALYKPTGYTIYGPDGVINAIGSLVSPQNPPVIPSPNPGPSEPSGGDTDQRSFLKRLWDKLRGKKD